MPFFIIRRRALTQGLFQSLCLVKASLCDKRELQTNHTGRGLRASSCMLSLLQILPIGFCSNPLWGTKKPPRRLRDIWRLQDYSYNGLLSLVGATGFEPATPCSQSRCATGLRYTPFSAAKIGIFMRTHALWWKYFL